MTSDPLPPLRDYQVEGVAWLKERDRALLADEPGLGKSRQLLEAAHGETLIVAPAMVHAGGVWNDELATWRPDLDATLVTYTAINDRARTGAQLEATDADGNPLRAMKLDNGLKPIYRKRWDTVILDESHYIKGRKTKWTLAINDLRSDRMYLATGTPIPNWAHEIFTALRLLHPDEARPGQLYGSYWKWAGRWFNTYEMWGSKHVSGLIHCEPSCKKRKYPDVCEHWLNFSERNLGGVFLQRLRDDVLQDLPPLTQQDINLPMSPVQKRMYQQLKKDYITWTEAGEEVMALSKAAQITQLQKLCAGVELLDDDYTGTPSPKFAQVCDRVDAQARPSMVVAHFKRTVRTAARYLTKVVGTHGVGVIDGDTPKGERTKLIRQFQAGDLPVLCASIETVKEGLTLTAADTVHRLERSWRPTSNEQVIRRLHRLGQTRPVTVLDYMTEKTLDQRIVKLLNTKTDEQMKAVSLATIASML